MPPINIILLCFSTIALGWAVNQFLRHRREADRLRAQVEIHRMLIEKVASSADLKVYLESEAFQRGVLGPPAPAVRVRRHVLGALPAGIALLVFGAGVAFAPYRNDGPKLVALLAIIVGTGLVGAGVVSYRLAKSWGMMDDSQAPKD